MDYLLAVHHYLFEINVAGGVAWWPSCKLHMKIENMLRYEFSKESEHELLNFLRISKENKGTKCDLNKHKIWKKILPLNPALKEKLVSEAPVPIIDLVEEENIIETLSGQSHHETQLNNLSQSHLLEETLDLDDDFKDLAFAIKENLGIEKCLSEPVLNDLLKFNQDELGKVFLILFDSLNVKEIFFCGEALISTNETIIGSFCKYLFIPKTCNEFCENLSKLFVKISVIHSGILKNELLSCIKNTESEKIKSFLQYLNLTKLEFQSSLLCDFVLRFEPSEVTDQHLEVIEKLLNNQTEYETLSRLVELIAPISQSHCKDKVFGKILMNIIDCLGSNLIQLEVPLKRLVAEHQSIYKAKLAKTFEACFEDSLMLSQTFRE